MKNITLSAQESVIRKARDKARREKTSLNALFREWLARYVGTEKSGARYDELMRQLDGVSPGRRFSRDEMNER